eukprot:gene6160-17497_t
MLAIGGNDVANAIGPFAGIIAAYNGPVSKKADLPTWVLAMGAAGMAV